MRLKTRLKLNAIMTLTMIFLMILSLVWSFREASKADRNTTLVAQMQRTAFERTVLRDEYLLNQEERARIQWHAKSDELASLIEAAAKRLTRILDKALVEDIRKEFEGTRSIFSRLVEFLERGTDLRGGSLPSPEGEKRLIAQIILRAYALRDSIDRLDESVHRTEIAAHERSVFLVVIFMGVTAIAVIVNSAFINSALTRRIAELLGGTEILGAGNLDHRIHITGNDELSDLARASNEMAGKLRESHTSLANLNKEIADRKRAEEELKTTLYSIGDAVITTDREGVVHRMNPEAEKLTGWPEGETRGKLLDEVFHIINEDTRATVENPVYHVLREGMVVGLANHTLLIARDGTERPIADSGAPIRNEKGEITGVVLVFRDQTEEHAAQRALSESESRFRTLFEQAAVGVAQIETATGRFFQINQRYCDIVGYSREEMDSIDFQTITHPDDLERDLHNMQRLVDGQIHNFTMEKRKIRKDGSTVWVNLTVSPMWQPGQPPSFHIAVVEDITRRKRAEELDRVRLALYEFSASHSLDELLQKTLDEVSVLTGSPIGFYHFVESDQETLSLQAWSTRTAAEFCKAEGKGLHYPIHQAGVWVDCVNERKPVIHNDYQALSHRKGLPEGHAPVIRELVVPIMRADRIVAILGIGNKPADYTAEDVQTVSYLADVAWEIAERKRTEAALQDSEKRYRRLFESAKDGILILDADTGRVVDVNPFLTEMLGYSHEVFCGKKVWDIGPFENIVASREAFTKLQEKEYARYDDLPLETRDGHRIDVEFVSNIYLVDHTRVIQCNIRDITEHKRAQEALRESEEQVRFLGDVLEHASQPFAVGYPDGRLGIFNAAFCELTGYGEDELRALDWGTDLTPARWREPEAKALQELERTGNAVRYEKEYIRKNGSCVPIEALVHSVRDATGRTQFYYAFVTDITERKRVEQEMRKLSMAVEQSPTSVEITDAAGNIEYVNPRFTQITGYALEEVRGRNPRILKSGQTSAEEYRELWATISTGGEWHGQFHNKKKDGTLFWERASISPIRDASGAITHFIAVKEDITAQKALEDQFRQAQKMEAVGRLAGGVAHDFNNMLGIVIGYAELAQGRVSPNDPISADLSEIIKAVQRSTGLVRQLLAFARRQTVEPRVMDLNGIIKESEKMLRRLVGEDIDIHFVPGADLWQIKMDPAQIDQILANFTVNARDAIPGVGTINIETRNIVLDEVYCSGHRGFSPGEYVMLAFSDSGTGMDKDVLEHIFEPFFTTKDAGKGTGLGLSTIYGVAKQNNGFINVYSEPGQGTTFTIYLPRHQGAAEEKEQRTERISLAGAETILVVEDDRQILTLAQKILERHGYTVIPAALPGEALVLCEKHPGDIHLLITDVVMPAMNGKELKERIENLKPGIKVLYMSGYTADVIAHRGIIADGVQFIQKPFSIDALARKVREVLSG